MDEKTWKLSVEHIPVFIIFLDTELKIRDINRTISDFDKEAIIGTDALNFMPESSRQSALDCIEKIKKTRLPGFYQTEYESGEGDTLYFEARIAPVFNNDEIIGFICVADDVTEQKLAVDDLIESEEKFSRAFNSSSGLMLISSLEDGKVIDANERYFNRLGYTRDELIGNKLPEIDIWINAEQKREILDKLFKGEEVRDIETQIRAKSGEIHTIQYSVELIQLDAKPCLLHMATDITERKQAERQVRLEKEKAENYLDIVNVMLLVLDSKQKVRMINKKGRRILGYTEKEIVGKNWFDNFVPVKDRKELKKVFNQIISGDIIDVGHYVNPILNNKGEERIISWWNTILRSSAGDIIGTLSSGEDITERTRVEESLAESERDYRSLIENAGIGIVVIQDGKQIVYNSKLCGILGYTADEYASVDFISTIHPDDRVLTLARMQNRMTGKVMDDTPVKIRVITGAGDIRWVEVSSMRIEWNNRPAIQAYITDITDRMQLQELYDSLTNFIPIGLYIYQDGKFRFVNPQFQKLTGYNADQLLDMAPYQIIHPDDRSWVRQEAIKMLKGNRDNPYVFKVLNPEHGTRWAMESINSIIYEGKRATLGSFMDVTENMLAEEALRQSEEKLRIIIESIPQGIMVTDLDGRINQMNKSAVAIFGYESDTDIIGKNALELALESDHERILAAVTKAREEDSRATFQYTALRKNGETFAAEMSLAFIKDSSGEESGVINVFEDITERQKMQEQLVVTDRLASVGELAAGIAHELNNPLTGVVGFSDLLLSSGNIPEEIKEDLATINKEAIRASQVARHLLTFARKHPDEKIPTDINEVIQIVLDLRAYEQRVSNINVLKNLSTKKPMVTANDFQLQQVFLNIVINAEHFMIEEHNKGILSITTEIIDDIVKIVFEDDGPGISTDVLPHIFDPFFTTKEVGKGTGLGLSICYGIITEHGGKLYAESEVGKGSRFIIELPASVEK